MRLAARTDKNQTEIVKMARSFGASVQHLHTIGKGCPDILVGFRGKNFLWEIKDGSKPPSKQKLTRDEMDWHYAWQGSVQIITCVDDVIAILSKVPTSYA